MLWKAKLNILMTKDFLYLEIFEQQAQEDFEAAKLDVEYEKGLDF